MNIGFCQSLSIRSSILYLKLAGCRRVYIGGSFITDKERPNDYDGCFDIFGIDEDAINPIFLQPDLAAT